MDGFGLAGKDFLNLQVFRYDAHIFYLFLYFCVCTIYAVIKNLGLFILQEANLDCQIEILIIKGPKFLVEK